MPRAPAYPLLVTAALAAASCLRAAPHPPIAARCSDGPRPPAPPELAAALIGSRADACITPSEPGLLLMGGGTDVDAAFRDRLKPSLRGGDIVVLRTTGTDAYNRYLFDLLAPDSVETLVVDTVAKANSPYVAWAVRTAELVWFAGGDQSDQLNQWRGTRLQAALEHVRDRGGLLGGTSAGLAILGDVIYDPDHVTPVTSAIAVRDPCGPSMTLSERFLDLPALRNVITESHFAQRDRMGRLLSFMARIGSPRTNPGPHRASITAIAIDPATSLFLDATGRGIVDGAGAVYLLQEDAATARTTVTCGQPIVYANILRTRLTAGDTLDLSSRRPSPTATRVGIDGRAAAFYTPADPYAPAR